MNNLDETLKQMAREEQDAVPAWASQCVEDALSNLPRRKRKGHGILRVFGTAVAACHALGAGQDGVHKLDLRQPGGTIQTTAAVRSGRLESITIGGTVTLGPVYEVEF